MPRDRPPGGGHNTTGDTMNGAACKGMGDLFFSDDHHDNTRAKAICATCACQPECLEQALRDREEHGVFGGYTARERWRMQRGLKVVVPLGRRPSAKRSHNPVQAIIEDAADQCGMSVDEFLSPSLRQPLARWRQCAMAAARHVTDWSYPRLAREFRRDHTTLVYAVQERDADPITEALVASYRADQARADRPQLSGSCGLTVVRDKVAL